MSETNDNTVNELIVLHRVLGDEKNTYTTLLVEIGDYSEFTMVVDVDAEERSASPNPSLVEYALLLKNSELSRVLYSDLPYYAKRGVLNAMGMEIARNTQYDKTPFYVIMQLLIEDMGLGSTVFSAIADEIW